MRSISLTWRDRIQLVNSVLFCVVGAALIARYVLKSAPLMTSILGAAFVGLGVYRLTLARREMERRAKRNG